MKEKPEEDLEVALGSQAGVPGDLAGPGGGRSKSTASAQTTATVTVVHGVPGVPVDVYVNGKLTLPNFQPLTVSSPLSVPPGTYGIAVRKAGSAATTNPIISGSASLSGGENASLVAYLNASGSPSLAAFVNDTNPVPAGKGRLIVRHTANAPAVDVLANGQVAISDLASGSSSAVVLPAGTITAAVAVHGSSTPVIGLAPVTVTAGADNIVYAIGSASAHTLNAVTQTVTGLEAMRSSISTGNSPIGLHHPFPAVAVAATLGLARVGMTVSARALRDSRSR